MLTLKLKKIKSTALFRKRQVLHCITRAHIINNRYNKGYKRSYKAFPYVTYHYEKLCEERFQSKYVFSTETFEEFILKPLLDLIQEPRTGNRVRSCQLQVADRVLMYLRFLRGVDLATLVDIYVQHRTTITRDIKHVGTQIIEAFEKIWIQLYKPYTDEY